jgi:capsular polysaccharide transport system ATP-binding protein
MIELKNVSKYFYVKNKKKYVFKDISLSIPSNVNIAILGKKGSGKTTLLKILGKIMYPSHGTVYSKNTFSWPLGQYAGFTKSMSGKDNIIFVCSIYGQTKSQIDQIVSFVKDFSELESHFEKPLSTYTSEMKKRLSFALNIALSFDYTLADDLLSVGDVSYKKKSLSAILKKIETSNIILVVSRNLKIIRKVCDVGIVINQGQLYYYNDINDAITAYQDINKKSG